MAHSQLWKIVGCALTLAACGPTTRQHDNSTVPAPAAEESTLIVRNDYFGDVDVYAVMGSTRSRIGAVGTGRTQQFRLSQTLVMRPSVQFQLDPVGPVAPFTYQPISITPGNTIELSAAAALSMSSYAIVVAR